jgi:tRNA uridine 5-carbamoylmethylation protein Kti12
MKRIICLWGGPGTGKTTTAASLFAELKKRGYNAELNREYIKDWVWEKRELIDGDQVYITAKQARKERIYMKQGLDFIITDSPLSLTTFYGNIYDKYEKEHQACK